MFYKFRRVGRKTQQFLGIFIVSTLIFVITPTLNFFPIAIAQESVENLSVDEIRDIAREFIRIFWRKFRKL